MEALIFVEVLDRRGNVAERVRIDALPATVGRSYRNQVIVDDRFVSPEHVRLSVGETGGVVAEDLDSENGMYEEPQGIRVTRVVVQPGTRLRVGHTVLRFATVDQPVVATAHDPFVNATGRLFRYTPRATAAIVSAALLVSMLTTYLQSYDEANVASRIANALMIGLGLAAWAGAWSLVTRIMAHRFAFGRHLAIASGVFLAAEVTNAGLRMLDVVEPGTTASSVASTVVMILTLAAVLFGHLALVSPLSPRRRISWSLGVAVGLIGLIQFAEFAERDSFDSSPDFVGAVRPVGAGSGRGMSLETFMTGAADLQHQVDADAVRRPSY